MRNLASLREQFVVQPPRSDSFVVGVRNVTPGFDASRFAAEAASAAGVERAECVVGKELAVAIAVCGMGTVAKSSNGRRAALLFGELCGQPGVTAATLAEDHSEPTSEFVRGLNGSWAMVRFDADRDTAVVITDRLSSRRVLHGHDGKTHWFASGLASHPLRGGRIDPIAVGWYLTHGAIYGNRTLYEAVRVLPPSTLHHVSIAGISPQRYWMPEFSSGGIGGASERSLQVEFGDLLVDTVRCRIANADQLWVSLSAGYDAAGIAGILGERIRQPNVRCFSYARGTVRKDSDESISAAMAERLGYRHEILTSYGGDYASWLSANARASQAMAGLCDEIDTWAALASQITGPTAAIMVGDECLGWTDYALARPVDALRAVQIQGGPHLAPAATVLDTAVCGNVAEGIETDIRGMLAEAPRFNDLHALKDYFYITQRAPNYILPWRQNFASRVGTVRSPLLDSRVLDFMATVPAPLRRQKALYRRTIRRLCPQTFALPRARSASYHIDHSAEFATAAGHLMSLECPELASLMSPKLQDAVTQATRSSRGMPRRPSLYKLLVNAIKHTAVGDLLRKAQPAPPVRNPSSAELLARLACLDRALVATGSA